MPLGASQWLSGKDSTCNASNTEDISLIPGSDDPLERGVATHSNILSWRTPWREDPGGLQFIGSQRVRQD